MEQLKIILKGFWVGSTMTVPGVSGGTMAVVVGIYEELLHAVNGLRREPGKQLFFLLKFLLGAGVGFLLFARFITALLQGEITGELTRFFFCGIVAGGIPLLVQKSGVRRLKLKHILCLVGGAFAVLLLAGLPQGLFGEGEGITGVLLQAAGGFLVAVALILPGISATHMLYILGLYEPVLEQIYRFRIWELVPLILGGLLGTFLTTGLLERLLRRAPQAVYLIIIGFVAASMVSLAPVGKVYHPVAGSLLAVAGFLGMYAVTRRAQ
ncbi:MAG: DUF368 domain-containing protein [Roseburia sp.]